MSWTAAHVAFPVRQLLILLYAPELVPLFVLYELLIGLSRATCYSQALCLTHSNVAHEATTAACHRTHQMGWLQSVNLLHALTLGSWRVQSSAIKEVL